MFGLVSSKLIDDRLSHAFFTRKGPFLSASSPEEEEVIKKWFGVASEEIVACQQVHGSNVCIIDVDPTGERLDSMEADAIVTNQRNVPIAVRSADCVPILLADTNKGIIGAIHAGWRGTVVGIIENTIEAVIALGGSLDHITCAIGPCIGQTSYEVGLDLYDQIPHKQFFKPVSSEESPLTLLSAEEEFDVEDLEQQQETRLFDLPGYVAFKLGQLSIKSIDSSSINTFTTKELFYSYRRHRNDPEEGYRSQVSIIMLKK